MSELTEDDRLYGGGFIRHLTSAWECCATCAGGVLERHDRAIKAKGWDEAVESAYLHETEHWEGIKHAPNPYRTLTTPADQGDNAAAGGS